MMMEFPVGKTSCIHSTGDKADLTRGFSFDKGLLLTPGVLLNPAVSAREVCNFHVRPPLLDWQNFVGLTYGGAVTLLAWVISCCCSVVVFTKSNIM